MIYPNFENFHSHEKLELDLFVHDFANHGLRLPKYNDYLLDCISLTYNSHYLAKNVQICSPEGQLSTLPLQYGNTMGYVRGVRCTFLRFLPEIMVGFSSIAFFIEKIMCCNRCVEEMVFYFYFRCILNNWGGGNVFNIGRLRKFKIFYPDDFTL